MSETQFLKPFIIDALEYHGGIAKMIDVANISGQITNKNWNLKETCCIDGSM